MIQRKQLRFKLQCTVNIVYEDTVNELGERGISQNFSLSGSSQRDSEQFKEYMAMGEHEGRWIGRYLFI